MIIKLSSEDANEIYKVINQAARAYKGVIPDDRYHDPYMTKQELQNEMENMTFFGLQEESKLIGVMCFQQVEDVTLIRHAYVLPDYQRNGVGAILLNYIKQKVKTRWPAPQKGVQF